jgi:hypothetical protein
VPRLAGAASIAAAWVLAASPAGATQQVSGSMDIGVSRVDYDGFLPSAAASISPSLRIASPNASFTARGTWLGFESGNTSLQALLAASVFSPSRGRWRGELSGTAGSSVYAQFENLVHLLARGRVHYVVQDRGLWVAATAGGTALIGSPRPVVGVAAGVWTGRLARNWTLSLGMTRVGDTSYTDLEGSGYLHIGRMELEGSLGARAGRGGGSGVYGEASARYALNRWLGVMAAGGRYPTDPTRGSVSGRYVSIGVRITTTAPAPPRTEPDWPQPLPVSGGTNGHVATVTLELLPAGRGLVVHAPDAAVVEVMGDFTDWEPVVLKAAGGRWRFDARLPSGVRRLNVRVNGGPWVVPAGASVVQDEFGAIVGMVVVP